MLTIMVVDGESQDALATLKELLREYQQYLGIALDFQDFEAELAALPGKFIASRNGCLYLACWNETPVGCAGFYQLEDSICELKRVFVKPEWQGKAIGKALLHRSMSDAQRMGHERMRLDSFERLTTAKKIYQALGFYEIAPYNYNPYEGAYYMEGVLEQVLKRFEPVAAGNGKPLQQVL